METKSCIIIACQNIRNEMNVIFEETGIRIPVIYMPRKFHNFPDQMREYLQNLIDQIENVDYILLPMGRCGNGTVGLKSECANIVLPKCSDCIDLILSKDDFSFTRPTRNYFITAGWLNNDYSIDTDYQRALEKYGEETTASVMKMIYGEYKCFTLVDTGTYDLQTEKKRITPLAQATELEINQMEGPYGLLRKMLTLEFDENFAVVPRNTEVKEMHFELKQ